MLTDNLLGAVDSVVNKYRDEKQVINTSQVETNLSTFYSKLEAEGFDLTELKPILECSSDMLILSGAGVGKTTTIILKVIHDFLTGDILHTIEVPDAFGGTQMVVKPMKILMGTFLKSGADELKASFYSWCRRLGIKGIAIENISFVTLHKEFLDAMKFFGANVKICEDNVVTDIVRSLMHKYGVKRCGVFSKTITMEEINDIVCLFTYCRNRLDAEKYKHPLLAEYNIDSVILEKMLEDFNINLNAMGVLDFEAIQELLYKYLKLNPAIYETLKKRYDLIIVDEFQDTSQLQYEILKAYFAGAKRKIVIGDDDQTIYSWRGSDIDIITHKFEEDYKPTILTLTANHRCPSNILSPIIPSIMQNQNRHPKSLKSSKDGGVVDVIYNITNDTLVESINRDLADYETVGIISRTNNDLLIPALLLELGCNVDFQTSKAITLNSRMPKSICSSIDLITKRYTSSFETILKSILPRNVHYEVSELCNVLSMNPQVTLFTIPVEDLKESAPGVLPFINGIRKARLTSDIDGFVYILDYMTTVTYARNTSYCNKARDFARFVKELVLNSNITANMDIHAIDRLLNSELPSRIAKRNKPIPNPRIKLTTVHEAKGKEWDAVYIWNDVDGTFPSDLTDPDIELEYEEERRLHYIAWTRAKKHLTVCTSTGNPSPFLLECTIPNVTLTKKDEPDIVGTKMINPKTTMQERVRAYLIKCINKPDESVTQDNIDDVRIMLGYLDMESLIIKVTDALFADKNLNTKNDDCIKNMLGVMSAEYLETYM